MINGQQLSSFNHVLEKLVHGWVQDASSKVKWRKKWILNIADTPKQHSKVIIDSLNVGGVDIKAILTVWET